MMARRRQCMAVSHFELINPQSGRFEIWLWKARKDQLNMHVDLSDKEPVMEIAHLHEQDETAETAYTEVLQEQVFIGLRARGIEMGLYVVNTAMPIRTARVSDTRDRYKV
jgi:hypothetical protein